ncbi:hypothetical protein Ae406Ps2_3386c [Pseudonocardia sp. Ae406_Ps2]|nr:hypothetical protein Ae331Ps2_2536 [Pseudonocardia sp. Ae331_Ps2]OLM03386.1 hypothetical protein Ae406Ps2_3386c [Pseudonocardia sp. Ae406_Ps2]OLM11720.1 hypothetical protein Ae505Ps2_1845 [Pseudonocardia sp. Ae505_Ps2]OLM24951.1 hypothetical protein Ae706Ps2_3384c [Pseudonocardia sp. Ae706_Ps2]
MSDLRDRSSTIRRQRDHRDAAQRAWKIHDSR